MVDRPVPLLHGGLLWDPLGNPKEWLVWREKVWLVRVDVFQLLTILYQHEDNTSKNGERGRLSPSGGRPKVPIIRDNSYWTRISIVGTCGFGSGLLHNWSSRF